MVIYCSTNTQVFCHALTWDEVSRSFTIAFVFAHSDSGSCSSNTSQSNGGGGVGSASGMTPSSKFDVRIGLESSCHSPSAWRVSWNCTGSILSSAGDDGTVRLWKRESLVHHPSSSFRDAFFCEPHHL